MYCIALFFLEGHLRPFVIFSLLAQIFSFIQVSALYTSMLWSIPSEFQCFGAGVAQIGFYSVSDGISNGLVLDQMWTHGRFEQHLIMLLAVLIVSALIYFALWKFVDFKIWDITKNKNKSKMYDLLFDESTDSSTINVNDAGYQQYVEIDEDEHGDFDDGDDEGSESECSQTTDYSEYSESDWKPYN